MISIKYECINKLIIVVAADDDWLILLKTNNEKEYSRDLWITVGTFSSPMISIFLKKVLVITL